MSTNFSRLLLAGLFLTSSSFLVAQERQPGKATNKDATRTTEPRKETRATEPRTRPATPAAEGRQAAGRLDHFLVHCLRGDNQNEIAIAEIGREQATDQEVKAFAEQMIQDHNEFLSKLQKFGGPSGRVAGRQDPATRTDATRSRTNPPTTEKRQPNQDQDEAKPDDRASDDNQSSNQRDLSRTQVAAIREEVVAGDVSAQEIMQLKDELGKQCLATVQKELSEKQGSEFDKCFMGMQIGGHMKMVDALTVFKKHSSPELQQVLDEGLRTSQEHLEHAKKLAKKLDQGANARSDGDATNSDSDNNN